MLIFRLALIIFLFSSTAFAMFIDLDNAAAKSQETCGNESFKNLPLTCSCQGGVSLGIKRLEKNISNYLTKKISDPQVAKVTACAESIQKSTQSLVQDQQSNINSALTEIAAFNAKPQNKIKAPLPTFVCISKSDLEDSFNTAKKNCNDPCKVSVEAAKGWAAHQIQQADASSKNTAHQQALKSVAENANNGITLTLAGDHVDVPQGCAPIINAALKSFLKSPKNISAPLPIADNESKKASNTPQVPSENPLNQVCKNWETDCDDCKKDSFKIIDDIARKAQETELKKLLYEKSMQRLLEGVEKFQDEIKMGGNTTDRPSEKLKDLICCNSLNSCLEDTSYGNSSMSLNTGYKSDSWQPTFCKGRKQACDTYNKKSPAIEAMDVREINNKISTFSNELKNLSSQVVSSYQTLKHLTYEETGCSKTLRPSQAKTGDPNCKAKILTPPELFKKILNRESKSPAEQAYVDHFNKYVAKHKILALQPYVLLLTKDLMPIFSGKNLNDIHALDHATSKIPTSFSDEQIRKTLEDFNDKLSRDAVCSMKRLYAGKPSGSSGDLKSDSCVIENLDLMSMIRHNQNAAVELIEGKGLENSSLTSQSISRMICVPHRVANECTEFWKKWNPYIFWGKLAVGTPTAFVAPWLVMPYFYSEVAINVTNGIDGYYDATTAQDQILAQYLKNEIQSENLLNKYEESEIAINSAQVKLMLAILSGAATIGTGQAFKNLSKKFILKAKGANKDLVELERVIKTGDFDAVENFVKKTTGLEIEIIEETIDGIKKTITQTEKALTFTKPLANKYQPIRNPPSVQRSKLNEADLAMQKELKSMNVEFTKMKSPSAVEYNVKEIKVTKLVDDISPNSTGNTDYGQVYKIVGLPQKTGKNHYSAPALSHPEMAVYKKQLEDMGYSLAVDTSLPYSGLVAYLNPANKVIGISPKTSWEVFRHEFQHAEFNKYLAPYFSKIVKEAKRTGPLKNATLDKILKKGHITEEKAKRIEELVKKGLTNRSVDETLSVDVQLKLLGLRRYVPKSGTYAEKYALQHQITELLKLQNKRTLSKVQLQTLKSAKKRFAVLQAIDHAPDAAVGTAITTTLGGGYLYMNPKKSPTKKADSDSDPNTYKQIIYSQDGKTVIGQTAGGDWVEIKNEP